MKQTDGRLDEQTERDGLITALLINPLPHNNKVDSIQSSSRWLRMSSAVCITSAAVCSSEPDCWLFSVSSLIQRLSEFNWSCPTSAFASISDCPTPAAERDASESTRTTSDYHQTFHIYSSSNNASHTCVAASHTARGYIRNTFPHQKMAGNYSQLVKYYGKLDFIEFQAIYSLFYVGTCESFFCVRIESRIESAVRFDFESNFRIESAVYTTQAVTPSNELQGAPCRRTV